MSKKHADAMDKLAGSIPAAPKGKDPRLAISKDHRPHGDNFRRLSVDMTPDLHKRVKDVCHHLDEKISDFVRQAIIEKIQAFEEIDPTLRR